MPLRDGLGEKADSFVRVASGEIPAAGDVLLPFDRLPNPGRDGDNRRVGFEIPNTTTVAALRPFLDRVALIAIAFPSFSDGRGFSLAKALRDAGFTRTLRAVGPLVADQFAYALACGFDEVEIPEEVAARQPVAVWLKAARAYRLTYQSSHQGSDFSILERRRAGRAGADA